MTLSGSLQASLDLSVATPPLAGNSNCVLGPFATSFSTSHAGGHPYTPHGNTATATVTDTTFNIPAVIATATCPGAAVINIGAPFPLVLPRSLAQDLDIFPPGVTPPSTTFTTTTTTTTTTVPPTVAPITTVPGPTLANSGSSSTPASLFAVAFIAGGLALMRPGRRRRTRGDVRLRRTFRR
jgi:hypothetical protein